MGLFGGVLQQALNNVVSAVGGTVSGVVGGIVTPVTSGLANVAATAINAIGTSNILNSSAANIAAHSLSGVTGGSSYVAAPSGSIPAGAASRLAIDEPVPTTFFGKLFNYYRMNSDGSAYEPEPSTGELQWDYPKMVLHASVVGAAIWFLYKKVYKKGRR